MPACVNPCVIAHQEVRLHLLKELVQLGLSVLQSGAGLVVLLLPAAEGLLVHVLVGQRQRPQTIPSKLLRSTEHMTLKRASVDPISIYLINLPRIIVST